jgi:hypothetical protein
MSQSSGTQADDAILRVARELNGLDLGERLSPENMRLRFIHEALRHMRDVQVDLEKRIAATEELLGGLRLA